MIFHFRCIIGPGEVNKSCMEKCILKVQCIALLLLSPSLFPPVLFLPRPYHRYTEIGNSIDAIAQYR